MLFACTSEVGSGSSSDGVVVADRVVEVGTDLHVDDGQADDIPFVTVARTSTEERLTLEASEDAEVTLLNSIALSEDTADSSHVVGEVDVLLTKLVGFVENVSSTILTELVVDALHAGITDDVNATIEIVGLHHNVDIAEEALTLEIAGLHDIAAHSVQQAVVELLSLVGAEVSEANTVKSRGELVDVLQHLRIEVTLHANFIVHEHSRHNREAPSVGGEGDGNHVRSVFTITDGNRTSVTDGNATIVVDDGRLKGRADRDTSLVLQLLSEDAVRVLRLSHERIESAIAATTKFVLVEVRVSTHVLGSGEN